MELPRRIHITGICGVATSALAIALHKTGVKVTGSDKGFFPPISTELEKQGVTFYAGWHPEKILEHGKPDLIIAGGSGTSPSNPEIVFANGQNIPVYSFAEAVGNYIVRKKSIVAVGTWGKTSNSALFSYILIQSGMKPSYFTGGVSLSHLSAEITDSDWSVVEGDEYQAAIWDKRAKFFHYKPTHLLLSAVSWDHADLYPTEEDYFEAFKKLVATIPASGLIVACGDNAGVNKVLTSYSGKKIIYGRKGLKGASYTYSNVSQSDKGISLTINHGGNEFKITSPMLGLYQSENITGCFAMASEIGIDATKIIDAISKFKGLKRRMEKRLDGDLSRRGVTIIDDLAHSPEKASPVLGTLRSIYDGKIIAVFEPNSGNRQRELIPKYDQAFKGADVVVIPRLSKLKISTADEKEFENKPLEGHELAKIIGKTHLNTLYIEEDAALVNYLTTNAKKGDVIVFLGSHGFRGMIEGTVKRLE